jgi:rod shape-determining protein MreC
VVFTELEGENAFLRDQLQVTERLEQDLIVSHVITRSTDESISTITIDQGTSDGVVEGAPVISRDGVFVGKVIRANAYNAIVLLVNDHTSQVAVSVQNIDHTIGIVQGEYGLGVKMELIPQTEVIAEGDNVITSGVEEHIPRGLLVGTIDTVIRSEEELFQEAVLRLPADLSKIHIVSVIKPSHNVDSSD